MNQQTPMFKRPKNKALLKIEESLDDLFDFLLNDLSSEGTEPVSIVTRFEWYQRRKSHDKFLLDSPFKFDNFIESQSNGLAKFAAINVAENSSQDFNPLLIHAKAGLGKTHLLIAIAKSALLNRPNTKTIYVAADVFVQDMVRSLQHRKINQFRQYYQSADLLLIDNIQFFAGKDRSQQELLFLVSYFLEADKQVVLASSPYPTAIDGLDDTLKCRFVGGLVVEILPPDLETRIEILIHKSQKDGHKLDDATTLFIAQRIESSVRSLEGALRELIANARFTGQQISLELAKKLFSDNLE